MDYLVRGKGKECSTKEVVMICSIHDKARKMLTTKERDYAYKYRTFINGKVEEYACVNRSKVKDSYIVCDVKLNGFI